jgi:hypothetical protein
MNNKQHKSKFGQVQLGESIAVVIIVMILIFIGIIFWNKNSHSNIDSIQTQSNELSVIEIANTVPELSEIKCDEMGVYTVKCIDYYKLKALSEAINNKTNKKTYLYYHDYFKNSKISVVQVYPLKTAFNITLYDAKLSNHTTSLLISLPINIKNYVNNPAITSYGFIVVEGYYINS